MNNLDKHLETIFLHEELKQLNEFEFKNLISKVYPEEKAKALFYKIEKEIKNINNPITALNNVKKLVSGFPVVNLNKLENYFYKKSSEFKNLNKVAKSVIENSITGASNEMKDVAAFVITIQSFITTKDENEATPKEKLKNNLKKFVLDVRRFTKKFDKSSDDTGKVTAEDMPDLAIAFVIVAIGVSIALSIILYSKIVFIIMAASTGKALVFVSIVAAIVIVGMIFGNVAKG